MMPSPYSRSLCTDPRFFRKYLKLFFVFTTGLSRNYARFQALKRVACLTIEPASHLLARSTQLFFTLLLTAGSLYSSKLPAQEDISPPEPVQFEEITTPYGVILTHQNMTTTMRDDTLIAMDIYRPNDENPHPTLYAAGPYPHSAEMLYDLGTEAGNIAWFVSQGYSVVVANVRGTGSSGGDFSFFSRAEQQDHYEIVEWIAEQAWSDGQVAGTGAGYYATSQWQMAIQNPPHLECIAPINGSLDPFRDWIYPGGLSNNTFINSWYDKNVRLANAYSPEAPRLVNYDLRFEQLNHQQDDDYWRIRSSLENAAQINVPVFAINNWSMDDAVADLKGTFKALDKLNVVNKILISKADDTLLQHQDTTFLARELLPYYEWCFSERSSSLAFVELPRIRYFVNGQNSVKPESSWPPGNVAHEAWYLNNASSDSRSGATSPSNSLDSQQRTGGVPVSAFVRDENSENNDTIIRFVSSPLTENLEIAGSVMLELYASSTTNDMAFEVTLREEISAEIPAEISPEPVFSLPSFLAPAPVEDLQEEIPEPGPQVNITRGILKASARARDDLLGSGYAPVYSLTEKQLLQPGQIYRLDIALRESAYRFSAGNRIVIEIKPVNDGSLNTTQETELLYHNQQYSSRLWLPVARNRPLSQEPGIPTTEPVINALNVNVAAEDDEEEEDSTADTLQFFVPR
ncbi:MAG: putative CocE/NonD family hydrolase [Pseudohongiellaceae bacterium]|jgi:putative CocE/NonD family hydrolase